ncbi:ABC transporter ATP-binding protein [Halopenitus persicus]|uniref:ABC-2 type transport system ATP-binding protein n=1 Tax=Halopenitus persicus TaxID=1048396 RepID=A0A1H3H5L3_9EURY|nr:ABC transporter ATP-binding protein [Halopenitus persicus]SDY10802.1 ABC-2 type transport system ATP-binding protein [Halopenitus persicus]
MENDPDVDGGGVGDQGVDGAGDPVLRADDVRKSYGEVTALSGADLAVGRGEVFGLIGPNGAGKTTLVRALTGTTAVEGTVRVLGTAPDAVDPERVGLLPQSFDPPGRLTARELVAYYAGLYDDARDVEAVLEAVGLASDADAWYETLSGGQRRRACVATALVNDPDVLFLDEPTTGIDPAGRRDIHRVIREAAAAGVTVFLTSHAMGEVERLADRVGLIREGSIVAVGSPESLIAAHGGEPTLTLRLEGAAERDVVESGVKAVRSGTPYDARRAGTTTARGGGAAGMAGAAGAAGTTDAAGAATIEITGVPLEGIGAVVDAVTDAGVGVESASWSEPSLEDVYLELTGEAYRPAGPESGTEASTGATPEPETKAGGDSERPESTAAEGSR